MTALFLREALREFLRFLREPPRREAPAAPAAPAGTPEATLVAGTPLTPLTPVVEELILI